MQRLHVRPAPVAERFDQPYLSASDRILNFDARETEVRILDRRGERIERLEKMDIRIPERVVGVENQIERISHRRRHLLIGYWHATKRANDLRISELSGRQLHTHDGCSSRQNHQAAS